MDQIKEERDGGKLSFAQWTVQNQKKASYLSRKLFGNRFDVVGSSYSFWKWTSTTTKHGIRTLQRSMAKIQLCDELERRERDFTSRTMEKGSSCFWWNVKDSKIIKTKIMEEFGQLLNISQRGCSDFSCLSSLASIVVSLSENLRRCDEYVFWCLSFILYTILWKSSQFVFIRWIRCLLLFVFAIFRASCLERYFLLKYLGFLVWRSRCFGFHWINCS